MKIGIVTGASSGIGRWFAVYAPHYFREIDELWIVGRDVNKLSLVASKLKCSYKILQMDLCNDDHYEILLKELRRNRPEIKLLVNCAGNGLIGPFYMIHEQEHCDTVRLNCEALTRMTRICLPYMVMNAHIINIASAAAFMPQKDFAVYAASKSYVLRLSLALSGELKKRGIYVTAVCPGCIKTPFFDYAQKYQKRKAYKNIFLYNARKVVVQSYTDALKQKTISIPGFLMKLLYIFSKICPFWV